MALRSGRGTAGATSGDSARRPLTASGGPTPLGEAGLGPGRGWSLLRRVAWHVQTSAPIPVSST